MKNVFYGVYMGGSFFWSAEEAGAAASGAGAKSRERKPIPPPPSLFSFADKPKKEEEEEVKYPEQRPVKLPSSLRPKGLLLPARPPAHYPKIARRRVRRKVFLVGGGRRLFGVKIWWPFHEASSASSSSPYPKRKIKPGSERTDFTFRP